MAKPVLLADIGGTNTRLALADGAALRAGSVRRYRNDGFRDLSAVMTAYLAETGSPDLGAACAALAGPVEGGTGRLTNLDWTIAEADLSADLGAPVSLINDLQAQGHALGRLAPDSLRPLMPGDSPVPEAAPRLVIGVGTGFNAASVHQCRGGRLVTASECGHISLPTPTEADRRLADFLTAREGFAEVEGALSGRGLANIDAWLAEEAGGPPGRDARDVVAALAEGEARAEAAVGTAVRLLGCVAGDLALVHLPLGGVYLIGGMARALAEHADRFGLAEAFAAKGRFAPMMARFTVQLVTDDYAALTGCAAFLAEDGAQGVG